MTWDDTFLELCGVWAKRSHDNSTRLGAVIVRDMIMIAQGYNGLARGVNNLVPFRHERPEKYVWYEHAERNAIYNAARLGISLLGTTLYVPMAPCHDCARGIIQVGIREVVIGTAELPTRWLDSALYSMIMFQESGVVLRLPNDKGYVRTLIEV